MAVDTHLGNARITTTHSGAAGMLRDGRVIVERADVLDLARALSVWHASNVREGAPGAVLDGIPFGLAAGTRAPTHLLDHATGKPFCDGAGWCRGANEPTTADRRLADCTRCIAVCHERGGDGDRQVGCARCDPRRPPVGVALDAAYRSIFTDAAIKEKTRLARLDFGPPGLDASVGPGPFVGRREVYTRAVAMLGDVEVIPGVELRVDEILEAMLPTVRACAQDAIGEVRLAIATLDDRRPIMVHAQRLAQLTERYITTRLPGRRYFIEVGNDREGWIQVCAPAPSAAEPAA